MGILNLAAVDACLANAFSSRDYSDLAIFPFGFEQIQAWKRREFNPQPRNLYLYIRSDVRHAVQIDGIIDAIRMPEISYLRDPSHFSDSCVIYSLPDGVKLYAFTIDTQGDLLDQYALYLCNFPDLFLQRAIWEATSADDDTLTFRRIFQMTRVCWNILHGEEPQDGEILALSQTLLSEAAAAAARRSAPFRRAEAMLAAMAAQIATTSRPGTGIIDFSTGERVQGRTQHPDPVLMESIRTAYRDGCHRLVTESGRMPPQM